MNDWNKLDPDISNGDFHSLFRKSLLSFINKANSIYDSLGIKL